MEAVEDEVNETSSCLNLLDEISTASGGILEFVDGINQRVQCNKSKAKTVMSILDVKNDTMLTYLIHMTYLILRKSYGKSIEGNNMTATRLAELRVVLEKIASLEGHLKYQIDKLTRIAMGNVEDSADKLNLHANVQDFMDHSDEDDTDEENVSTKQLSNRRSKDGLYVPPRLSAVHYGEDSEAAKKKKLLEKVKRNMMNTSIMQELREEYMDVPSEISQSNTLRTYRTKYEQEKEEYEETYFTRLPTTKKDKKLEKLMSSFTSNQISEHIVSKSIADMGKKNTPKKKFKKKRLIKKK